MKRTWFFNAIAGAALITGLAAAAPPSNTSTTDEQIEAKVLHEIRMYPRYSIFDDVKFRVSQGNVSLLGEVNQPYKKSELGKIIGKLTGVVAVDNELKVAPLSGFDDRLRIQIANSIYRDPTLSRYGMGTQPSIHILVDNGKVTLEGVVDNDMAKNIAGIRASGNLSFGPVVNNLQVTNSKKAKS